MVRVADTSWLTLRPVNPLNIGQLINNETRDREANVSYQEANMPPSFPLKLRKFLPIINYEGGCSGGTIRIVYLQANMKLKIEFVDFIIFASGYTGYSTRRGALFFLFYSCVIFKGNNVIKFNEGPLLCSQRFTG